MQFYRLGSKLSKTIEKFEFGSIGQKYGSIYENQILQKNQIFRSQDFMTPHLLQFKG